MGTSYLWHHAGEGRAAELLDTDGLRALADEPGEVTDGDVGVAFADAGGGAGGIVYGTPAQVAAFLAAPLAALADGGC